MNSRKGCPRESGQVKLSNRPRNAATRVASVYRGFRWSGDAYAPIPGTWPNWAMSRKRTCGRDGLMTAMGVDGRHPQSSVWPDQAEIGVQSGLIFRIGISSDRDHADGMGAGCQPVGHGDATGGSGQCARHQWVHEHKTGRVPAEVLASNAKSGHGVAHPRRRIWGGGNTAQQNLSPRLQAEAAGWPRRHCS